MDLTRSGIAGKQVQALLLEKGATFTLLGREGANQINQYNIDKLYLQYLSIRDKDVKFFQRAFELVNFAE